MGETVRRSKAFFLVLAVLSGALALTAWHAAHGRSIAGPQLVAKRALVRAYGLSDLCLFTEAGYTRHASLTDPLSPYQDGPHSLEHFPSGSLVAPPPTLARWHHD